MRARALTLSAPHTHTHTHASTHRAPPTVRSSNFIRYSFKKHTHASWLHAQRPLTSRERERNGGRGRERGWVGGCYSEKGREGTVGEIKAEGGRKWVVEIREREADRNRVSAWKSDTWKTHRDTPIDLHIRLIWSDHGDARHIWYMLERNRGKVSCL